MGLKFHGVRAGIAAHLSSKRRGALAILAGTAGGQLLALVTAPVLSRLYSPSDFGLFTVVSSLVAIVGTVAALRFELAVVLPEKESDAHGLVALGLMSVVLTFMMTSGAVALTGGRVANAFDRPTLMPWLWCVPAISMAMGVYLLLNQLAIRHRRYSHIGRRNLLQSVAMLTTQIGAAQTLFKSGGLVLGLGVGQVTSALSLLNGSGLRSDEARDGRQRCRLRQTARRYRRFPLVLAPSGLLNVLGLQLPVILIAFWFGSSTAGWIGLTMRVLSLPVMLVGTAVSQVYVGELARSTRDHPVESTRLFVATSRRLLLLAAILAALVIALSPGLFGLVFGPQWRPSGTYAQALAISLAAQLVAVPVSPTLTVYERQTTQLAWDAGRLALTAGAVALCYVLDRSPLATVWAYGVTSAVAYVASWGLSMNAVRRSQPVPTPHSGRS